MDKVKAVVDRLKGLERVVIVPFVPSQQAELPTGDKWAYLDDFLSTGGDYKLQFEQLPFNHPLYILYSSGTTGKPKCIVHSAGASRYYDLILYLSL